MQVPNAQHHHAGNLWWQFHEADGLICFVILLLFWGLLLVSVLAATGTLFWIGAQLGGDWPARVHWARQLHGALGNLVWYYLALHAGAAVIYEFFGHRVLRPMVPLDD